MEIIIGLIIIAIGAFCQSSSYVPIKKIKSWSWESYWLVQGIFAWIIFPLLGCFLAIPAGHSIVELYSNANAFNVLMTIFFGVLWGVGGLTFGLSMRYLGVALGQSIALGTCAGLGTIMGPILLNVFFPEQNALEKLTMAVILGVVVTLIGIAVIGIAGAMKSKEMKQESTTSKEFNFPKGLLIALLAGLMSGCFNVGLTFGAEINFAETDAVFKSLPAVLLVTLGGFVTNASYCLYQNGKNKTWSDYKNGKVWVYNLGFCALAGVLWYSQFFGLSMGQGFFTDSPDLITFSFCILMALNVTFSNVWGIVLKEWKGCSRNTIMVLILGLIILIFSSFLPQLVS